MFGLTGLIRVTDNGVSIDAEAIARRTCELRAYRGPDDSGDIALEVWGRTCIMGQTVDDVTALVESCESRGTGSAT